MASRTINEGAVYVDDVSRPALAVLCDAMIAADERRRADAGLLLHPHVLATQHKRTRRLATLAEEVGRALLRYLTAKGRSDAVERAVVRLAKELSLAAVVTPRRDWGQPLGLAATMIENIALEEFGLNFDVVVAPDEPGLPPVALVWRPANRVRVYTGLEPRVLQEVVAATAGDPLLRLEYGAAKWWFDRWTPPLPNDPLQGTRADEARLLRRLEWVVAGRDTVAERRPLIDTFLAGARPGKRSDLRLKIARALRESLATLFVVRGRHDDLSVFEEPVSGDQIHVREDRAETRYRPGNFALGRIFPFGDGTFLRSPAMVFYTNETPGVMDRMQEEFFYGMEQLGPEIAIEIFITTADGKQKLPRHNPPAESPEEAQRLVNHFWQLCRTRLKGKKIEPPPDHPPEELARIRAGEMEIREFKLDRALSEWFYALDAQSQDAASHPG